MRAIVNRAYGRPDEVMVGAETPAPQAGPGEVVVAMVGGSVNAADWHVLLGEPYVARLSFGLRRPRDVVLGCDVAGEVVATGPGVGGVALGDRVLGCTFMRGFGAFAEQVRVPVDCLAPLPASVAAAGAAVLPLAGLTALQALRDHARLSAGQRLLVIGASGGVGSLAVQLAVGMGAEVTATCRTQHVDLVRSLGAHRVIDRTAGVPDGRYDVVLQAGGRWSARRCISLLTRTGTLVPISGDSRGRWLGAAGRAALAPLVSATVPQRIASFTVRVDAQDLRELLALVEQGRLRPVVDRTFALDRVPAAVNHLLTGGPGGKVAVAARAVAP